MSFSEKTLMTLAERGEIDKLLVQYVDEPHNDVMNFILGYAYNNIGQTAAAVSFYLRAAEKSDDLLLRYEALVRCSNCFDTQGSRNYTTRGLLQHAVSIMPSRPEAYYLMSKFHERNGEWQEAYMMASIGLGVGEDDWQEPLRTNVGYPGKYGLLFQLAVPAWWVGLCQQSREILNDLKNNYEMDDVHRGAVLYNLKNIGHPAGVTKYDDGKIDQFKFPFNGLDNIAENYSQSYQDMFVLAMLNGKRNGTYLELGCGSPFHNNNTALLETKFGWKGISIDLDRNCTDKFFKERSNTVFCLDALQADYATLLDMSMMPKNIDYLQLDCDPPWVTLAALKRIPFDKYRFATITFEHDVYRDESTITESREYLSSLGYVLVVNNLAFNEVDSYEDWWVHPDLVDSDRLKMMTNLSDDAQFCTKYMFK